MKQFDIDWRLFLRAMPTWEALSPRARTAFLAMKPSQPLAMARLGDAAEELLRVGWVTPRGERTARVAEPLQRPLRALRAMKRSELFERSSRAALERYLTEHLSRPELMELGGGHRHHDPRADVAERVGSSSWVRSFLQAEDPASWEWELVESPEEMLTDPEVAALLETLLRRLLEEGQPLPVAELHAQFGDSDPLARALHAGLRYLLLFAALRPDDLAPLVGLYPPVLEHLRRPPAQPPRPVAVERPFRSAMLLEDMTSVLVACAADPPRLTSQGTRLFARARGALEAALVPVPEPVGESLGITSESRLRRAVGALTHLEHLQSRGKPGADLRLEVSEGGRAWLAGSEKDRLGALLDHLIETRSRPPASRLLGRDSLHFLPSRLRWDLYLYDHDLASPVAEAFAEVGEGDFYDLHGFLAHAAERRNPLPVLGAARRLGWGGRSHPSEEHLERLWRQQLWDFFTERLFPLSGAEVGLHDRGRVAFRITGIGRYLLGLEEAFDYLETGGGEVVVQPDFEVVFLSPSPPAEAALGRFARRQRRRNLGALFKITRESVYAAAAGGMTLEQVLETLDRVSNRPLPGNVRRQLADWFSRCRRVRVEPAVIVHCPDADAALRLLSVGGSGFRPLSETVVAFDGKRLTAALRRRLREAGIFVDDAPP